MGNRMKLKFISMVLLLLLPLKVQAQTKYWVFFKDKGLNELEKLSAKQLLKDKLLPETLERRAKVLSQTELIDEYDLEIYQPYLDSLKQKSIAVVAKSRWLNAVSVKLGKVSVEEILVLPFVRDVRVVSALNRKEPPEMNDIQLRKPQNYQLDYGASLQQNELIRVTDVHDLGLSGAGVIVGMLDTGFNYEFHEAFQHLKILGEYDVINDDSTTKNEQNDLPGQHSHGTISLSVIAGFKETELIGPAYNASYFLAKTEDDANEYPQEEDFWVAGLEWLESRGVDVASSSLGYNDWYRYSDMDGNTAVTTLATNIAALKGVVVVNSMGNEGNYEWRYMIAPADGKKVISVGATYADGSLVGFSSRGPTYDGRIKPDVVAMGSRVYTVSPNSIDRYASSSGTSFSCPQVAGVAALILEAHPGLGPEQVRDALRETADRAYAPDNDYGWGLVDAYEAVFYFGLFFSSEPEIVHDEQNGHLVKTGIFSKHDLVNDSLALYYKIGDNGFSRIELHESGTPNIYQAWIPVQAPDTEIKVYFTAKDQNGDYKTHPRQAPDSYFVFQAFDSSMNKYEPLPDNYKLFQNRPNPFNKLTAIEYDVLSPGNVSITVYNIRGQKVKQLTNEFHTQKRHIKFWDGLDEERNRVSSGIYFYRLKTKNSSIVKRMVLLRE